MSTHAWSNLGLPRVLNAAGKMTYLGSATLPATVVDRMAAAATQPVEMAELARRSGDHLADLLGVPAAAVAASASAGLVQAVAATVVGADPALVQTVPDVSTSRRRVVLQQSHAVDFGAPVTQLIRLGGGVPVPAGSANRCAAAHLAAAIDADTAAVLYVVSHHVHAETQVSLAETVELAHAHQVPVIVDAAAESDLTGYVTAGADLVVYSGHKAIGGPTSGLVVGARALVDACAAQSTGVGRTMKVGKETIAGLLAAVEAYQSGTDQLAALTERVDAARQAIGTDLPVRLSVETDATRPIPRLIVELLPGAGLTARELIARLEAGDPSVRTRNHDADRGRIGVDPRELTVAGAAQVGQAIRAAIGVREQGR
jgi:uncharacterized pyridoxal phosphate-dependent enzyme